MASAGYSLAAACCALFGMAWLALAMKPHWEQVRGRAPLDPRATRTLRVLGVASVLASLALCLAADHVSMAPLVWVMTLSASALAVSLLLAYRPRWLGWLVAWTERSNQP